MAKLSWKGLGIAAGLSLSLVVAGCGSDDDSTQEDSTDNDDVVNYGEEVDYSITGIETGAGVFLAAEDATEEYESLDGWEVQASSSGAMATTLGEASADEEPILGTGWPQHGTFSAHNLT